MGSSTISLGLGLGGGKAATSSGSPASGGGGFANQYSVSFDGSDDYMSLGDSTIIQDSSSGAFTWSLWVKTSDAVGGMFIARSDQASGSNTGFRSFEMGSSAGNDTLYFVVKNAGGTTRYPYWLGGLSSSNISDGDWHNLVFVNEGIGGIMYIYFDGVSQTLNGNKSGLLSGTTTQPLSVGAMEGSNTTGFYLDGIVDEVAAWDSALTSSNVTSIYNSGVPNDISSLNPVGWWRMGENDGGTGTTITDQGSGSNNGTLVNGPTFSTSVPS